MPPTPSSSTSTARRLDGSTVDTLGDFVEVLSRVLAELQLQLLAVARGFEELTSGLYLCLKRRRRPA